MALRPRAPARPFPEETPVPVPVLAAVPTPFGPDGRLDTAAAGRLYRALLAPDGGGPGVSGLLVAGTTGEFPALLDDERLSLARTALGVWGPERIVLHVGSASAHQAAALAAAAAAGGVRRLAAITPYYLTPDPDRLVDYYRAVARAAPGVEVWAYLFPECTGHEVEPATFARIAAVEGIVGAKLSGSAADRVADYAAAAPGAALLVGTDTGVGAAFAAGAAGSITALAAAFPATAARVATHLGDSSADTAAGRAAQADLARAAAAAPGVGPTKAVLAARGLIGPDTRMPVPLPDEAGLARIAELAAELT